MPSAGRLWAAAIRPQTAQRAKELKAQLCDLVRERPATREALYLALSRFDGEVDQAASWRELDALIRDQFWRVAHFRVAADDVNFRRFFNINDLAGVRVEVPQVFDHAHQRVLRLIKDGVLDGLRIDHIDGLLDPKGYLRRLRRSVGERHCYIVAEKILASHEWLPEDWPIEGTTGYDFANLALGLMVDPAQEASFSDIYAAFSGQQRPFGEIVRECKLHILDNEMASELNGLAREHARLARQNARTADFTQNLLRRALRALIACFPVYRTYVDAESPPDAVALRDIDWALAQASRHEMELDPSVFDFLRALLHGELIERPRSGFSRQAALRCVMKLQQLSGPVMAKGLEDTAFYRYNRFIALNEVGGSPERFGLTLAAVHKANAQRAQRWPHAMLGTSTHDSKHGEDVRARLAALSELPQEWAQQLGSWSRILRGPPGSREPTADGGDAPPQPDRNDEYLFYQLLLGTWPVELLGEELDPATLQQYRVRLRDTMIKSIREARLHSRWAFPDQSYEDATSAFIDGALDSPRSSAFLAALLPFARRIAALGAHNSLLQTVFKLTCPGMPDFYQGSELWELSMVDPDNRREVDFELRTRTLQQTRSLLAQDPGALVHLFRNWRDGAFKLATTAALLDHRRRHAAVFAEGTYDPLAVAGARADEVCAYARQCGEQALLVLLARFPHRQHLRTFDDDTVILLPPALQQRRWHDVLGGRELPLQAGAILGAQVFRELPVAVCYTPTEP
jgi:(1->4)-alpha-D-glucan 1-alpha-D-glucosylmutase